MTDTEPDDEVLYLNGDIAVVRKKIGEVCENPAENPRSQSIILRMKPVLEARAGKALPFIEAVHRLDQPVSGGVILAFDKKVFTELSTQFSEGTIRKRYLAIVEKPAIPLAERSGSLEHWLWFDPRVRKSRVIPAADAKNKGAKRAVLDWTLFGEGERYLFLSVEPRTGRTHQIRAQLAAFGLPIKGDLKYGAKRSDPGGGIRLHAQAVQFRIPGSGDVVNVSCPIRDPDSLWSACLGSFNG